MALNLTAILRRLLRRRDGVAAIEFAFAFPIVLIVVMGIFEVSMMLFVSSLLEGGLRDAARFGITGATPAGGREQAIIDIVNSRTIGLVHVQPADVKMRTYQCLADIGKPETLTNDVNGNGQWDPGDTYTDTNGNGVWDTDKASSGAGGAGQVVVYDIVVNWHLMTPFLASVFGNGGVIPLGASIAVRNEPWIVNNAQATIC